MFHILKDLPIHRKLKLAFGTIILFSAAAVALGVFGIGTVFNHSRTLYTDCGQAQGAVNRMLADFKQNQLLTATLLLNEQPQGTQTLLTALEENRSSLIESFSQSAQLGYLDHLEAGELANMEALLTAYFAAQTQVQQLAEQGEKAQAIQLFTQSLMPDGEQVDAAITHVIETQAAAGQAMLQQLADITIRIITALGIFFLVVLCYSLVITLKMSGSIRRCVQDILSGMEGLRDGKLSTRIPQYSRDDFGQIAQEFNSTCQALDEYAAHVNHTMQEVSDGRLVYQDDLVFQGDFLTMQQSIIRMVQQENQLIQGVKTTTQQVTSASGQVSASA